MDTVKFIRRISFRGLSLQRRLPLLICVLLLCSIVTFGWISYIGVKNTAMKNGKERLHSLADQLSTMFSQQAATTLATSRIAANQESIKKYLQTNGVELSAEALEILRKQRTDSTWVLAELVNADLQPVLRSGKDSIKSGAKFDPLLSASIDDNSASVGKIYLLNGSMYYPVIVPVVDNKQVIGHLVKWQILAVTQKALDQFSQLMGTKSRLYLGNIDGSLWTDLMKPVSYHELNALQVQETFEYSDKNGKRFLAAAKPVPNTSWLVSVEFPRQSVLETASRFLQWISIIGGILIIAGIFIGWLMSRTITKPLNKLTAAASAISKGDYSITVAAEREDEVGKLSRAFNTMIEQVNKAREGLEQKVIETIEVNEQLHDLSAYLQNVREDERKHIAREMHDELGQLLTGFKMDVSWLRKKTAENNNDPVVKEKLEYMLAVIDEAVKFVRNLASELRPSILDDLGLIPALEWHSQEFEKRYNIKSEFNSNIDELDISSVIATGLFRMYQESLTNVARHSNATKVVVNLKVINDEISLSISDNGKGFDASQANKKTLGLLGMKERAAMIGGKLEIISEAGKGTTIVITANQIATEKKAVVS